MCIRDRINALQKLSKIETGRLVP